MKIALVALCVVFPLAALAQDDPPARKVDPAKFAGSIQTADLVFTAKVGKVNVVGQTRSIPPSIFGNVMFKDVKAVRGKLPDAATFSFSYREGSAVNMDLTPGAVVVVAAKGEGVLAVVPATDANRDAVKKAVGTGE